MEMGVFHRDGSLTNLIPRLPSRLEKRGNGLLFNSRAVMRFCTVLIISSVIIAFAEIEIAIRCYVPGGIPRMLPADALGKCSKGREYLRELRQFSIEGK